MLKINQKLKNKKHIIAVSGGKDSMVLLDLVKDWDIVVAHVNHKKRSASEVEEKYLVDYCNNLNIPIEVMHLVNSDVDNFQAYARNKRYQFFKEVLEKHHADDVMLAHHGDDLVETVLMSMTRGTGLKGLVSMQEESIVNDLNIIRPLIKYSVEDIINYINTNKITYFEDKSNREDNYTRNRFRMNILPELKRESSQLVDKFSKLSEITSNVYDFLIEELNKIYKLPFMKSEFTKYHDALKQEYIVKILHDSSIKPQNSLIEGMLSVIESNKANAYVQLSDNLWLIKEYDSIDVRELKKPISIDLTIDDFGTFDINDDLTITVSKTKINKNINQLELCYNKRDFPLKVRTRKTGDVVVFDYGKKKLKDLFIDLKIPKERRDGIILVEANEKIVWIPELNIKSKQSESNDKLYISLNRRGK